MEQGPTEQTIIQQCVRNRAPLPDAIANAPQLLIGLELFYGGFMDLIGSRMLGFSEGPIPWSAVGDYCDELGIEGDQREDFFYHIQRLDTAYLELRAKQAKKAAPVSTAKKTASVPNQTLGRQR